MKILCVSDQIDPLVYSANAKNRFKDAAFVISAGDLPMEYLDFIMSSLNKNVYFVFGNHNLELFQYYRSRLSGFRQFEAENEYWPASGAVYLGFKTACENNILMAGLTGSMRYNDGEAQYSEREMTRKIIKLLPALIWNKIRYGRYIDILVTHAPPYGIHDKDDPCHRGFKCLLWFMKKFKPRYLLHGHIHLYDMSDVRVSQYCDTQVINVYSHYMLEIE